MIYRTAVFLLPVLLATECVTGSKVSSNPALASAPSSDAKTAASDVAYPCPHVDLPCAALITMAVSGPDGDEAEILRQVVEDSAIRFTTRFGRAPAAGLIVPGGRVTKEMQSRIEANGYAVTMPWIGSRDRDRLLESQVRRQVEDQMDGRPPALIEAAMQSALQQLRATRTVAEGRIDLSALSHELGHKWFMTEFSKDGESGTGHAYGGWAPDWLDEAAAVSMESDALKERRRKRVSEMESTDRIPLAEFLSMEHPGAQAARELQAGLEAMGPQNEDGETPGSQTSSRAIVLSGKDAEDFVAASGGDRVSDFYAQALLLTDYLEARTGSPSVLAEITTALLDGSNFELWIAGQPDVPNTLSALQLDWDRFLASSPLIP